MTLFNSAEIKIYSIKHNVTKISTIRFFLKGTFYLDYFIGMNVIGRANLYELISVPYETYRNFLMFQ
jgi:hypothetical protein